MSIRERIAAASRELAKDAPPVRMREIAVQLSALLSNVNQELAQAEIAYKHALGAQRQILKSAAGAKMEAERSPEYARWVEARMVRESCLELVRTCRQVMRSQDEEFKAGQMIQHARGRCLVCEHATEIVATADPREFQWICPTCGTSGTIVWATHNEPPRYEPTELPPMGRLWEYGE